MTITRRNYGQNHSYLIDGVKVPGVTTVLSKGIPKPALPYWSARTVAEFVADAEPSTLDAMRAPGRASFISALKQIPWSQRNDAARRGKEVHTLAEKLIADERVDVPEELAGYVDSAVKFMDRWKPAPLLTEKVVGSYRWGYAGTFDLVAEMRGQRWLLDYKTSGSGIWPETAVQLAGYRFADCYLTELGGLEIPMSEVGIERCAAVWIRADGYDLVPVVAEQEQFDFFLHALQVARKADSMSEWVLPELAP